MSITTRPEGSDSGLRTGVGGIRSGGSYTPAEHWRSQYLAVETISPYEVVVSIDKGAVPDDPDYGAWTELTLTANPEGAPITNLDGSILARYGTETVTGWQTYRDTTRVPGRWMHYGLFALYNVGGTLTWKRVDCVAHLAPGNFNHAERMFATLPQWYQEQDDLSAEKYVWRLLAAHGLSLDQTRAWVETMQHLWDPSEVPAKLLEPMSEVMGMPYEGTVGETRMRKLLSNLVYLRKIKGTQEGVENYLSALSGYKILAADGPNRVLTVNDGEFLHDTGNWTAANGDTQLTRMDAPVAGNAPPAPQGVLQVERINSTGTLNVYSGDAVRSRWIKLADGTGRELQASLNARTLSGSHTLDISFEQYDDDGASLGFTALPTAALSTTFDRVRSDWISIDDSAAYVRLRLRILNTDAGEGFQFGQLYIADRRYRPEGLPGYVNSEPFAQAGDGSQYTDYDFYDAPRATWLNVFPNRTNFAVNSDFKLDNLPADGWTVVDAPTYGTLPYAYSTYALVAGGETDYADLADGFNSLTPDWTVSFDTSAGRMELNSSASDPFVAQVRSKQFPVLPGLHYSASADMQAGVAGTKVSMRIQWLKLEDWTSALLDENGTPMVTVGPAFDLTTQGNVTVDIRNAVAPEGAGWGRLIIESAAPTQHTTYVQRALIEDAAVPGPYFNGGMTDGAVGDFGYIGTDQQTFSVYYLNYTAVAGSSNNRILTASERVLPLHSPAPRIITAYSGLYELA